MDGDIAVDRLPEAGSSLEVVVLEAVRYGSEASGPRRPHRHDYHELVWTRCGEGEHLIDGEVSTVEPNTLTLIGRGQVHIFERARDLTGAVIRFGDELLGGTTSLGTDAAWLFGSRAVSKVQVPPDEVGRLEAVIGLLDAEAARPADARSIDLQRHHLSALLLWVDRWHEASRTEQRADHDPELQLYRRFVEALEHGYARHHDAPHYADALAVPQPTLSRALVHVTGRTTKQLITDRRMLEAARLLRFSGLTVGEIAYRAGYGDQLYFSRAFRRHVGHSPTEYRRRVRGRA